MNKLLNIVKTKPFLFVVTTITLTFNLIGLIQHALNVGTLDVRDLIELLLLCSLYFFIYLSLFKNYYHLFCALVLTLFAYDSFLLLMESGEEVVHAIKERIVLHPFVATTYILDFIASLLTMAALVIYIIEIYTSKGDEKLFMLGKNFHLVASLIFIATFCLHVAYVVAQKDNGPFEMIFYSVSYTFSPLAILSLTLNTDRAKE